MVLEDRFVELLEEVHRLKVARATVLVRLPLAVLTPVVEIEHIRDCVDAQPVDVELLEPEQRIRDEEALHLCAPVVEIGCAPLPVLRACFVIGLIEVLAVEMTKPLLILAEMPRHPVHDDADAVLMRRIDQIAEVIGRTVAARHGEVARRLIAPRTVIRVLAERHELDVSVVHVLDIADELIRQIAVGEILPFKRAAPRSCMHFIGEHGALVGGFLLLAFQPRGIAPLIVVHIIDAGGRLRLLFRVEPVGVRLHDTGTAPLWFDRVFVDLALTKPLDKGLPDLTVVNAVHRVDKDIPVIELADNTDSVCVRRPYRKSDALLSILLNEMRSEHFLCMIVCALMKEVKIKLTERRCFHTIPSCIFLGACGSYPRTLFFL